MNRAYNTGKPWTVCHESDGTVIRSRHGGLVARMESGSQAMRNADAALIVKAPDVRDALADLVRALDALGFADSDADVSGADCVDTIAQHLPRLRASLEPKP